ncbi:MAG: MBL fold metallo-hydrolase [Calditrichaeota bacterium]|nr:MBL fold metallo-hydrolase [Calditrichota bacterium]
MKVTFWGTRGSIPSPGQETIHYGGNTTCLEIELSDGTLLVFDAGTGIKKLGQHIVSNSRVGKINIFFTHSHWDHIQGFPLFAPAYSDKYEIEIYSCPPVFRNVQEILTSQMDARYFPVRFSNLKAKILFHQIEEPKFNLGAAVIECIKNNHPGGANGFKVTDHNKILVFITDNELHAPGNSSSTWEQFVDFCRGADLLIHDSHYLSDELRNAIGWGHSSYEQAFQLGIAAGAKELLFFHHDPDRTDGQIDEIVRGFRERIKKMGQKMKLDAATEGTKYRLT